MAVFLHTGSHFSCLPAASDVKAMEIKLEMWGRAQREATRRCASNWGHNLEESRVKIPLIATSRVPNAVTLAYTAKVPETNKQIKKHQQ